MVLSQFHFVFNIKPKRQRLVEKWAEETKKNSQKYRFLIDMRFVLEKCL